MNKLKKLADKYSKLEIEKPEYIENMHKIHSVLFDYSEYIKNTDIQKIVITDDLVTMTSRGTEVTIACDSNDYRIAPIEILNFNYYEKNDSDMIFKICNNLDSSNPVIFDIGANIGWYAINLAKQFPECKVMAFEPIPKTFSYLETNIGLNLVSNINIYNHGFSDNEKELTFYYYPEGSGNASSARLVNIHGVEEISCKVIKLDNFIDNNDVQVDFIKCDVEGAELFVFQGGVQAISKYKPVVFTEMLRKWSAKFNYHPNKIIGLFSGIGYKCFTAHNDKLIQFHSMNDETVETNFFFLHSVKHEKLIELLI